MINNLKMSGLLHINLYYAIDSWNKWATLTLIIVPRSVEILHTEISSNIILELCFIGLNAQVLQKDLSL